MAQSAADSYDLATNTTFRKSVVVANKRLALTTLQSPPSSNGDFNAVAYAKLITESEEASTGMVWAVATRPDITESSPYDDVAAAVDDLWDSVSGYAAS